MATLGRLAGFLLTAGSLAESAGRSPFRSSRITSEGELEDTKWDRFTYSSAKPLLKEEQLPIDGAYRYPLLLRRSPRGRMVLLSKSLVIVNVVLEAERIEARRQPLVSPPQEFRRVKVAVHDLVADLTTHPTEYVLTRVDANVPAFGQALKYISFYGDDIAEAVLFREYLPVMRCYACGLRSVAGTQEILRIGSSGVLSCSIPNRARARAIEEVLFFLAERNLYRHS
jgi:hypothetical protein